MIGKTTKGNDFDRLLEYIERKPEAQYVGGNMIGTTRTELVKEFQAIARRSYRVRFPVAHISLSPHPDEKLNDSVVLDFAQSYLNKIHFEDCQWVLYRHNDTKTPEEKERPHFHIVANRVKITDGKAVSSWKDWRRSEQALRELEKEFGLLQVQPSWETDRSAPSTGQQRRYKREKKQYEEGKRDSPPEKAVKSQIQEILDKATTDHPTLPEAIKRLQQANILAYIGFTHIGKVKGISYQFKEVFFSGTQLGKAYTFKGLQKYRNVSYEPERDDKILYELTHPNPTSPKATPELTQNQVWSQAVGEKHEAVTEEQERAGRFDCSIDNSPSPPLPNISNHVSPNLLVHPTSELPNSKLPIEPEQKALADQFYPYAWKLFQYAKYQSMVKKISSGVFCFKIENYTLVYDESGDSFSEQTRHNLTLRSNRLDNSKALQNVLQGSADRFWVLHRERGEILHYKAGELRAAQGIELRDIINFLHFVEQEQQHKRKPSPSKSSEIER